MKALAWGLVLAVLAIAASLFVQGQYGDHGNVIFMVAPWRIDVSLNFFLLLMAGAVLALFALIYFAIRLIDFPGRVRAYRQRREEIGSQRALRESVRALLEGRFARAEREARVAQVTPENFGIASLLGARAAHRLQAYERRDDWLGQAEQDPTVHTARLVGAAEMWSESRENERALDALEHLHAAGSRHVHAARVALTAQAQAGRWRDVLKSVRVLSKRNVLHPTVAERLRSRALRSLLAERRHDATALEAMWNRMPAQERLIPDVALDAARLLSEAGSPQRAAQAVEAVLKESWGSRAHEALLDEYARNPVEPVRPRIEHAEGWLGAHPNDAPLLRCLGLLCLRAQLWGKAKGYLEASLKLEEQHPATLLALAKLAENLENADEAARLYRDAAVGYGRLAMAPSLDVPLPERRVDNTL